MSKKRKYLPKIRRTSEITSRRCLNPGVKRRLQRAVLNIVVNIWNDLSHLSICLKIDTITVSQECNRMSAVGSIQVGTATCSLCWKVTLVNNLTQVFTNLKVPTYLN